jgi:hypothetical protein
MPFGTQYWTKSVISRHLVEMLGRDMLMRSMLTTMVSIFSTMVYLVFAKLVLFCLCIFLEKEPKKKLAGNEGIVVSRKRKAEKMLANSKRKIIKQIHTLKNAEANEESSSDEVGES